MFYAFALIASAVAFVCVAALCAVAIGQGTDSLTPPLSYVPLGGMLLLGFLAAAGVFWHLVKTNFTRGRRRSG
jgi:hypothetical protein